MKAELVLANLKRERGALNGKLERIEDALNKEWQDEDQEYLCTQQYNAMCLYAHILDERIADIEYKLEQRKELKKSQQNEDQNDNDFNKKVNPDSYRQYSNISCNNENDYDSRINCSYRIEDLLKEIFDIDVTYRDYE